MSKKTFATAPRPKPLPADQIEAYVSRGTGHDTRTQAAQPAHASEPEAAGPMKRLSLDLPQELHRRFKASCAATGRKMGAELVAFIEARTAELEAERHK